MSSMLFHNDTRELNLLWYNSHKNLLTSVCIELGQVDKITELSQKFLGPPLKIKALKDPNKPKRAKTSYFYFCDEMRPPILAEYRKNNRKIIIGDVAKKLSKMWTNISLEDKQKYTALGEIDKQRYLDEMEVYAN